MLFQGLDNKLMITQVKPHLVLRSRAESQLLGSQAWSVKFTFRRPGTGTPGASNPPQTSEFRCDESVFSGHTPSHLSGELRLIVSSTFYTLNQLRFLLNMFSTCLWKNPSLSIFDQPSWGTISSHLLMYWLFDGTHPHIWTHQESSILIAFLEDPHPTKC